MPNNIRVRMKLLEENLSELVLFKKKYKLEEIKKRNPFDDIKKFIGAIKDYIPPIESEAT